VGLSPGLATDYLRYIDLTLRDRQTLKRFSVRLILVAVLAGNMNRWIGIPRVT
jgi:hypothetical protein